MRRIGEVAVGKRFGVKGSHYCGFGHGGGYDEDGEQWACHVNRVMEVNIKKKCEKQDIKGDEMQ